MKIITQNEWKNKCGRKKYIKEEFIRRAILIHGTKYDYSKVIYIDAFTKVVIICPVHGEFEQLPNRHLVGRGCQKCAIDLRRASCIFNLELFIQKARNVHGDKFDYSKVIYKDIKTKVIISCQVHGDFEQTPASHLAGNGCIKCRNDSRRLHINEFIEKAIAIHNSQFDYNLFIYKNNKTKGKLKCNICKTIFTQTPADHLQGYGCPRCQKSKGELDIIYILDKHDIDFKQEYKLPEIADNYRYDFYLPDYRILIEFHGKQHYEYIPFFHRNGEDDFLAQKNRDDVKRHAANLFKYKLLEFNYNQINQMNKDQFEELVMNSIKNRG